MTTANRTGLLPFVVCLLLFHSESGLSAQTPAAASSRSTSSARGSSQLKGRLLSEALLSLQERGLAIVFTSELVRPDMKVLAEPLAGNPRQMLDEVLSPHGLQVREEAGGVLVVVSRGSESGHSASIQGTVFDRESRRGLGGAVVKVVELGIESPALDAGVFSLVVPAPASYTLEANAPGYLPERTHVQSVVPGDSRSVVIRLHPELYLEDAIVVQPSQMSLLQEKPESSFSLGREEIESLPHLGGDVFRTTSLLPGVTAGDVTAQFSVHGGRRDEVKILFDGQEIYGTYHLRDYDNALSIVHAQALAGATLTTGAYPVSQGDRMSAVFDLRTVDPEAGQHFALGLSVLDVLGSGAGRFAGGRGSWLLVARQGSITLAHSALGGEDPNFWDAFGKAELSTPLGTFTGRVLGVGDTLDVKTADVDGFETLRNQYNSVYGWLTHQTNPSRGLLVETIASWTRIDTGRGGSGADQQVDYQLDDQRTLEVAGLTQTWTHPVGDSHLVRWGWEARRYDAFFDYTKSLAPDFKVVVPFSTPRKLDHQFEGTLRGDHLGVWASDRFSLHERLTAELGLRYDRHTATDDTLLSPRINVGWRASDQSVVRAAWGRFFQSQRPYELQVEDGESTLQQAELSQHYVLGYERFFTLGRSGIKAVRVELFRREIEDPRPRYESLLEPVNFFPETEPDRARLAPQRSTAEGVELLLRGNGGQHLDWWLAYSRSRSEDQIDGKTVPRSLDQPHAATLDLNLRLPRGWNLNLAWRYRTGWPVTPVEETRIEDPDNPGEPAIAAIFGDLNSDRFPDYHRLDLRAGRKWNVRYGVVKFFVDVQNVYNQSNRSGFDLSVDRDTDTLSLQPEYWPKTFPSLGIIWEF